MDLDSYSEVKRTKVMIYGPPKVGKTALVGALAKEGFTLWWLDLENGVKTLMQEDILPKEFRKNVKLINIPDHRAYPVGIDVLRRLFKGGAYRFCYSHGVHSCPICTKDSNSKWSDTIDLSKFTHRDILVTDSWTQVSNSAANKVTLKAWQKDEEYKMTFDDFRMQGMYLDEVLSKMQVSNINIAVISHDVDVEKSETKERIVPNGGSRNFSKTVAKYFDSIVYMQVLNKKHSAYADTTWDNIHLTGSRKAVNLDSGKGGELSLATLFGGPLT